LAQSSSTSALPALSIGEIARAMGYTAGKDRAIDPLITQRIASDVFLLNRVVTWAADGPYERQKRKRQSGWIAPLIVITAVHVEQETFDGPALPYEFDAMLGRNWAAALANTDILQVAPGFIELDEESAIRLAWYYLTEFRYRMTRPEPGPTLNIAALCDAARIDPGLAKNRARFLERLERWHALLQRVGVIGSYERVPPADVNESPGRLFTEANYRVEPPKPILEAYQRSRQYALNRRKRRPKVHGWPEEKCMGGRRNISSSKRLTPSIQATDARRHDWRINDTCRRLRQRIAQSGSPPSLLPRRAPECPASRPGWRRQTCSVCGWRRQKCPGSRRKVHGRPEESAWVVGGKCMGTRRKIRVQNGCAIKH
jgi:hypothetical protein